MGKQIKFLKGKLIFSFIFCLKCDINILCLVNPDVLLFERRQDGMKNKQYRDSKLKHTLFQMKQAKKRNPIWKLTPLQVSLIESWGFPVYPYLYRISTKPIHDVKNKCGLLKQVHFTCVKDRKKYYNTITLHHKKNIEEQFIEIKENIDYNSAIKEYKINNLSNEQIIIKLKEEYHLSQRKIASLLNTDRYYIRKCLKSKN